VYAATWENI